MNRRWPMWRWRWYGDGATLAVTLAAWVLARVFGIDS
jgi:hypothetical protein